jgi:sugar phosphate isomerase/epimerase
VTSIVLSPTTIPNSPPLEYLHAAVDAGYDAVGLRLNASPGMPFFPVVNNADLIRTMKEVITAADLQVLDIYSFYLQPPTKVAAFEAALHLGAELGAKYIVVMGADDDWSRMRDNFVRLCDLASLYGLGAVVETAVMRPLASLPQAQRLIDEAQRENAGICIDPLNFARAGDTVDDLRRVSRRLLPYGQLTDGIIGPNEPNPTLLGRMGPNQRRLLGQGSVPLEQILDALPPGIPLSVELPPPDGADHSAAEWAKIVLEDARRFLARIDTKRKEQ